MHAGNVQWLNVAAPGGLQVAGFVIDWAMWGLSVALILYLVWLDIRRARGSSWSEPVASSVAPASR